MKVAVCNRRHPGRRCCPRWSGHQLERFGRNRRSSGLREVAAKSGHGAPSLHTNATGKAAMNGTNIPEGHRRSFESLTRADYDKLRDQAGIVADARLHNLCHSHARAQKLMQLLAKRWARFHKWPGCHDHAHTGEKIAKYCSCTSGASRLRRLAICDCQTEQRVCFLTREPRQNPGWMESLLYLS